MLKKKSDYINTLIALAAMAVTFLYLLRQTWLKWGDLLVDTFREFWVPLKLIEGNLLYRDVFYTYGFFPPYLQAFLFKIFGPHLHTLAGLGIMITLLAATAIYLITRLFSSIFVAALTVIVFFLVFGFNHYFYNNNFNFILPYSFASTLFLLFTLYAVYFFLRFIRSGRHLHLFCWALCLTMAMFCRVELPLLVWGGFLVSGLLYAVKTRRKSDIRLWLLLFLPIALGLLGYVLLLSTFSAWNGFAESVLGPILRLRNDPFQKLVMGTDNLAASLKTIAESVLLTIVLLPLLGLAAAGTGSLAKPPRSLPRTLLLLLSILGLALIFIPAPACFEGLQYRGLALFLPAGLLYYAVRFFKEAGPAPGRLQMFCLFLTALLMASRMLFNMGPEWYGFYLLVPGLICYHLIAFQIMTTLPGRVFPGTSRRLPETVGICFLLLLAIGCWSWSNQYYAQRTAAMITDKGTFRWFDNEQTRRVSQAVSYLRQATPPRASVVVFPEGISLNILAERKNPLKYCNFMPPVMEYIGQDKLIKALVDKEVDYVVIVGRTAFDYGRPFFGVHYGRQLFDWIQNNYRLEQVIGARPFQEEEQFGVAVYRKIK